MPPLIPKYIEPILKQSPVSEYIESFSWMPREINKVAELKITSIKIMDHSRKN